MASNIVKMVLKLDDKASPALKKTGTAASDANTKTGKLALGMKAAGASMVAAGLAAVGATKAFLAMGQEFADQINMLNDMSTSTGLSVETLEDLKLMAKATGVNIKGMERGLVSFQKSLGEAKVGTGQLSKALETLGLDPAQFRDTDEAFRAVLSSIHDIGDASERAMLLNQAFGISAKDMAKVMVTSFDAAAEANDILGARIGDTIGQAQEMQQALAVQAVFMDKLKRMAFQAFTGDGSFGDGISIVMGLLAGMLDMLTKIGTSMVNNINMLGATAAAMLHMDTLNFKAAGIALEDAADSFEKAREAEISLFTGDWIQEGISASNKFSAAMEVLTQSSKDEAAILAELDALMGEMGGTARDMDKAVASGIATVSAAVKGAADAESLGRLTEKIDKAGTSTSKLSDKMRTLSHEVDGLFPAGVISQAEAFSAEFADLGISIEDSTDRLQEMESLLARLESGAFSVDILGGMSETQVTAFAQRLRDAIEAEKITITADTIDVAGGIQSGAAALGALAAGDVAGAAGTVATMLGAPGVGAIVSAIGVVAEIGEMTVMEIKQNAEDFVENLEKGFEVIARALPDVIEMLIMRLPAVLLDAAFIWIPELMRELPLAIFTGMVSALKSMVGYIAESIRNALRIFGGEDGERRFSWGAVEPSEVESFHTGTARVNRTGMALLHRNETVIPAGGRNAQDQQGRMAGGGSVNINISTAIMDRDVIPRLVREIDRAVGKYGRTSAAFAGG